jgi:putative peptide zinc metalloprotease protein
MVVELFIASLALFFWVNAEPGVMRTLAYNTIFIAGTSTLFFNGNPLLRYDGYYILSDLIEIPNLRNRSNSYLLYLCERYLFGNKEAEIPQASSSERTWFVTFGILSFIYRIFVVTAILLFIATKFFGLGLLLAAAATIVWFITPLYKGASFLFANPRLRPVRARALTVTVILIVLFVGFLGFVPMPYRTGAEGVIWIPEESLVRAGADGFIESLLSSPDSHVDKGTALVQLTNTQLATQEKIMIEHVRELEATYQQYLPKNPVKAETTLDELQEARTKLEKVRGEIRDLVVRSGTAGTFTIPIPEDLPNRYVHKGELIGYVLDNHTTTVRAVVSQSIIDLVRARNNGVEVRLSEHVTDIIPAKIIREVPGADEQLPAKALGTAGGGKIVTDPTDARGMKAAKKVFQLDLQIPAHTGLVNLGGRCYVRFNHGDAPLAVQFYFQIRQVFLSRFNV